MIKDVAKGRPAKFRSPKWKKFESEMIIKQPYCAVCGNTIVRELTGHHMKPYHAFPELELDPENILIMCYNGPGHINCHLVVGHCGNWRYYNPNVIRDAKRIRDMLNAKVKV